MAERWTDELRWVAATARQRAVERGAAAYGCADLLWALVGVPDERMRAMLRGLGVSGRAVRMALEEYEAASACGLSSSEPELDAHARRALDLCLREALLSGAERADSSHLLRALLREPGHPAGAILLAHGLVYDVVVTATERHFCGPTTEGAVGEGAQCAYLIRETVDGARVVIVQVGADEVTTSSRAYGSLAEAVDAVVLDVERRRPYAACFVVNDEVVPQSALAGLASGE